MSDFERIGKGVVKRTERRLMGVFIDGVSLDRATKRMNRRVDFAALIRGVSGGLTPVVARYYTLIPFEDDARQLAFLGAIAQSGLEVVMRRLPPKGVERQISVDVEMAADIIAFTKGHDKFSSESVYLPDDKREFLESLLSANKKITPSDESEDSSSTSDITNSNSKSMPTKRVVTLVCPSRDLSYPIGLCRELGADTVTADFSEFSGKDVLKSAAKWMDLSNSETIWRD